MKVLRKCTSVLVILILTLPFTGKHFEKMLTRENAIISKAALYQDVLIGKYTHFSVVISPREVRPTEIQKHCPPSDLRRNFLGGRHLC